MKYINNTPTSTYVPILENDAVSHQQKTEVFQKTFFPHLPPADVSDIGSTIYPNEVEYLPPFTIRQIRTAINQLSPNKAPGPDEIPNKILKHALPVIEDHILYLMQASLNQSHFPTPFKTTTTVVLRKPNKPDYTKTKAYHPIALESTLGKVLESIIANCMSYLTETYEMRPKHHYGGTPGRSTEDAMMILVENIHKAWKNKKIFTAIFIDVAGAFNNVHHQRLTHNLQKRGMPNTITRWIQSFLQNRSTHLLVNGMKTEPIPTSAGVHQGSLISLPLYMYNADLLEVNNPETTCLGFIDDIMYGVEGDSDEANTRKLEQTLLQAEIWRKKHGAQFETSKYILVHFTCDPKKTTESTILTNGSTTIPSMEERYLGVVFDEKLTFKSHLQNITKKGTKVAMALARITKCNWRIPYQYARQLFNSVIAARTDYAACIWHWPNKHGKSENTAQIRALTTC